MQDVSTPALSLRKHEITAQYLSELEKHIAQLKAGEVDRALEIRDFAQLLHIHPVHLSNTIKETTGQSACYWYEESLLRISKELLITTTLPIGQIAIRLTYDPSNFTKFFKQFAGTTPRKFREATLSTQKS